MRILFIVLVSFLSLSVKAQSSVPQSLKPTFSNLEDLDPNDPQIEQQLKDLDRDYETQTGTSAFLPPDENTPDCYRLSCAIYAHVDKAHQVMLLYVNGQQVGEYLVSTGIPGRETPDMDTHPDGRIYDAYNSVKFPGGDYEGLGNMPYAVFIQGGYAIHGTPKGNWPHLGHVASHGCIRTLPDNAKNFNRLVRQYGVRDTWVTVE